MNPPVSIGAPPFAVDNLTDYLDEFLELNEKRPIKKNINGMRSPHTYAAWLMVKLLQPKCIIESGVGAGQGTWFFEKAAPNSRLICIDPLLNQRKYVSKKAEYTETDFSKIDWDEKKLTGDKTLCFFDDHKNALERVSQASKFNFKHLIFEDNYPKNMSLITLKGSLEESGEAAYQLKKRIDVYWEFPPVVKTSLWRGSQEWLHQRTKEPLLTSLKDKYNIFVDEAKWYTWICYTQLKNQK